jgi:hypothetical protein
LNPKVGKQIYIFNPGKRVEMQVNQSVVSGSGEQKTTKNSKAENVSSQKASTLTTANSGSKSAQLKNMSAYLKIVSRLENMNARQDSLPEPAIQGFIQGIEKQVSQMNDHEKALLLRIPEVKALNAKNVEELIEKIEDNLLDEQASVALFELLRQPQFVELIDPTRKLPTYVNANPAQPAATIKGDFSSQPSQQQVPANNSDATAASQTPTQNSAEPVTADSKVLTP